MEGQALRLALFVVDVAILSVQTLSHRMDAPTGKLPILVLVALRLLQPVFGLRMSLHVLRLCTFSQ